MPSKAIVSRYSCKRKRDFITGFALTMFALLVIFQLYLTLIVPIQLDRRNAYELHVYKDELASQIDAVRLNIKRFNPSGDLRKGEVILVRNVADQLAIYTSEYMDQLDAEQVRDLKSCFGAFDSIYNRWVYKPYRYYIVQEQVNQQKMLNMIIKNNKIEQEL